MCTSTFCGGLLLSSSSELYGMVIERRNAEPDSWERKLVTELSLPLIALLGVIEGIVKIAIAPITAIFILAFGNGVNVDNKDANWADNAFKLTGGGASLSFEAVGRSLIGLVQNLTSEELSETGDATKYIFMECFTCFLAKDN